MQRSADRVRDEQREREEAARTRKLALLSSSERAVADAVFKESVPLPEGTPIIRGYAWPPRESPGTIRSLRRHATTRARRRRGTGL